MVEDVQSFSDKDLLSMNFTQLRFVLGPSFYFYLTSALIISLPLGGFVLFPFAGNGLQPAWFIGFIICGFYLLSSFMGHRCFPNDILIYFWGAMFCIFTLSLSIPLISGEPKRLLDFITTWLQFALGSGVFIALTSQRFSEDNIKGLIRCYIVICLFMALIGILQFVLSGLDIKVDIPYNNPKWNLGEGVRSGYLSILNGFSRSNGLFREPRQFGSFFIGGLVVLFNLIIINDRFVFKRFWTKMLILIVITFGLLSSLSVSAIFVALISICIIMVFRGRRFLKPKIIFAVLSLVVVIYTIISTSKINELPYWKRFKLVSPNYLYDVIKNLPPRDETFRFGHYAANIGYALRVFIKHPVIGVGLNNMEHYAIGGYHGSHHPWRFIAETGVLGSTAFFFFWFVFLLRVRHISNFLRKSKSHEKNICAIKTAEAIVLTAPVKMMGTMFSPYSMLFWLDLSLAALILFQIKGVLVRKMEN